MCNFMKNLVNILKEHKALEVPSLPAVEDVVQQ